MRTSKDIGKFFGRLREERGISQEAVSVHLGVHQTTIGRMEEGRSQITIERLVGLCDFFEIAVWSVFGEPGSLVQLGSAEAAIIRGLASADSRTRLAIGVLLDLPGPPN